MRPTIQAALNSGSGPDVFYYDTGPGFAGVLAGHKPGGVAYEAG